MRKILNYSISKFSIMNEDLHVWPFVISIPHSGLYLPEKMARELRNDVILANADWYLPELFSFLFEQGYTVLINNVSRYVVDPNRKPAESNNSDYQSALIYTKTTFGKEMYSEALSSEEIKSRISNIYLDYHAVLQKLIAEKQKHFDKVYLLDLHSFGMDIDADVVLGNGNGQTTQNDFFQGVWEIFTEEGFKVAINKPFSGGFITKRYGKKGSSTESLQIEISYDSYICKRSFGEEECPDIDRVLMGKCRQKLKTVFTKMNEKIC